MQCFRREPAARRCGQVIVIGQAQAKQFSGVVFQRFLFLNLAQFVVRQLL